MIKSSRYISTCLLCLMVPPFNGRRFIKLPGIRKNLSGSMFAGQKVPSGPERAFLHPTILYLNFLIFFSNLSSRALFGLRGRGLGSAS